MLEEDGRFLVDPVAVGVFEHADASEFFVSTFGVVNHLDDEHPPVLIEAHRHRIDDVRLRRRQFEVKTGADFEGLHDVFRFGGGDARKVFLLDRRLSREKEAGQQHLNENEDR